MNSKERHILVLVNNKEINEHVPNRRIFEEVEIINHYKSKMFERSVMPPRTIMVSLGRKVLNDFMELFARWANSSIEAIKLYRQSTHKHMWNEDAEPERLDVDILYDLVADSESMYGKYDQFEMMFVKTLAELIKTNPDLVKANINEF